MATALAEAAQVEESLWSQLMKSSAPPAMDSFHAAIPAVVAVSPPDLPEAAMTSVDHKVAGANEGAVLAEAARAEAARAEAVRAEAFRIETVTKNAEKTQAALPRAKTEAASVPRVLKPTVVNKRPNVPVPSQNRRHPIVLAAVVVVVTAIGVGAYWLRIHGEPTSAGAEEQTLAADDSTVAERQSSAGRPLVAATTAAKGRRAEAVTPQNPALVRRKPAVPASSPTASDSVPKPATEAPVPAAPPRAPDIPAPASPPAPPVGPFFETTQVNEMPRVATRVEPQPPEEFKARPLNEIVIVRVLVSQGGHPSRISLLRRSKTGARLDDAVIAAVNQWTFSPARKRGEAVSCWLNFGVPVGRSD